jgi:FlaA1/EpsC-like NDP-sugar epimerase
MARHDKVVLIAGGAGSIGSALAERLVSEAPENLILVDKDENSLELVRQRIEEKGFQAIAYVCDCRNLDHLNRIFTTHTPDLIIQAAAHKHVVSGQRNVAETTHNNLLTTLNLLKLRHLSPSSKFIQISTDKSVSPSSVMGASKMLCESMVRTQFPRCNDRNYIIRFGNVMDTNGSVRRIWDRQLKEKVPLTVTDLSMKRWLMPISDACDQILRVIGFDAGTYALDMGDMFTVQRMLEDFLKERGLEMESVEMKIVGGKAGEKSEEKLSWECESSKLIRAGQRTIIKLEDSPIFDFKKALQASETFDDAITLRVLSRMFQGLSA